MQATIELGLIRASFQRRDAVELQRTKTQNPSVLLIPNTRSTTRSYPSYRLTFQFGTFTNLHRELITYNWNTFGLRRSYVGLLQAVFRFVQPKIENNCHRQIRLTVSYTHWHGMRTVVTVGEILWPLEGTLRRKSAGTFGTSSTERRSGTKSLCRIL